MQDKYWIVLKLANFNLVVDRRRLLMTTKKGEDLKKVRQHFAEIDPEKTYRVENFAVKVTRRNRQGDAIDWEKTVGFSLWEDLPVKEPDEDPDEE